jgi:hypothetical protein
LPTQSGVPGARRHTLAEYQRHLEKFGPECVLETAAGDLDARELGELAALIGSMERTGRYHNGEWVHSGQDVRVCEECGKDLPKTAGPQMRRHPHCRDRLKKRRKRAASSPT